MYLVHVSGACIWCMYVVHVMSSVMSSIMASVISSAMHTVISSVMLVLCLECVFVCREA